jgi:hypothetical protein
LVIFAHDHRSWCSPLSRWGRGIEAAWLLCPLAIMLTLAVFAKVALACFALLCFANDHIAVIAGATWIAQATVAVVFRAFRAFLNFSEVDYKFLAANVAYEGWVFGSVMHDSVSL